MRIRDGVNDKQLMIQPTAQLDGETGARAFSAWATKTFTVFLSDESNMKHHQ
jgi:hypothetical protein